MFDRFSIRDVLSYTMIGFYAIMCSTLLLIVQSYEESLNLLKVATELEGVIIVFAFPFSYVLGHFIQGVDLILFKIGKSLYRKNKWKIIRIVSVPLFGHRINRFLAEDKENFWTDTIKLLILEKYEKSNYWIVLHIMLEGLTLTSFAFSIIFLLIGKFSFSFLFSIITLIFWFRGREMAINYVYTVRKSIQEMSNSKK